MSKNIDVNEQLILNYLIADDCDSLKSEIEKGLDPNQQFFWIMSDDLPDILTNSPTLLSVAAFQRAVKCFNYLLEIGADINKLDEAETPICHFAVAGGSMEIIQKLDEKGVQFTSSLQIAAKYGRFEIFKWLLDNKGFDINERDQYNRTFLHIASEGGNCELVKFLIEKGLDINSIDGTGWTPLHFAVENNQIEVVKLLLSDKRVNVNCKDFVFETSLLMFHEFGNCMPLHLAVHKGNVQMVKTLLQSPKIDVNCKDSDGNTPMHIAVMNKNKEIVEVLLQTGKVDLSIKALNGKTPLELSTDSDITNFINRYSNSGMCNFA